MKTKKAIAVLLTLAMVFQFCLFSSQGAWAEGSAAAAAESQEGVETDAPVSDTPDAEAEEEPAGEQEALPEETEPESPAATKSEEQDEPAAPVQEEAEGQAQPSEEETPRTDQEIHMDGATYIKKGETEAVGLFGEAAESRKEAKAALDEDTDLSSSEISKAVDEIFEEQPIAAPAGDSDDDQQESGNTPPRSLDGSNIEGITAKWITTDTTDNEDAALLYVRPSGLEKQSVRLQINYALSGEHNYDPGDITITVPAYIFKDRNGKNYGNLIIPYPEDPSKRSDFNWKLVGDHYVLTNTKRMSAATKGFIQFQYDDLYPQMLVDMQVSAPFDAYIEVVTHKGNTIALHSNELTAQFDTQAKLTNVSKYYQRVTRVKASQIPEDQRIPNEEEYIKVDWYVRGTTAANTYYTIDQTDAIPQGSVVESRAVVATEEDVKDEHKQIALAQAKALEDAPVVQDGQIRVLVGGKVVYIAKDELQAGDTVVYAIESEMGGFVIGGTDAESTSVRKEKMYTGYADGLGRDYAFSTAYPASKFEPDVDYTFHNSINYIVTEVDPAAEVGNPNVNDGVDPQLVTGKDRYATAQTTWHYSNPKWIEPGGHYMIHKNGNDDTPENNITHKGIYTYVDTHRQGDGYYGIYPSAINQLQDENKLHGEDGSVRLSYTIETIGYTLPWMYKEVIPGTPRTPEDRKTEDDIWEVAPTRIIGNYNRPIQMTSTDTGISIGRGTDKLEVLRDYTYAEVEFPNTPYVYAGKPQNINPDGTWTALTAGDGTFNYRSDSNKENWPDITLQIQRNGKWEDWAVASWKSGSRVVTLHDGTEVPDHGGVVAVPEDTENVRTIVVTQNTKGGEGATEAIQAGIDYDIRVVINLKSTKEMMQLIDEAFKKSNTPSMFVYNSVNMLIEYPDVPATDEEHVIHSIDREGYDSIRGYTTDTAVYPYKSSTQKLSEVDYEARTVLIHYNARVEERSVINDKKSWQQAVDDGRLVTETHGTWRDLLPKGVTPDLSTIKLRAGDTLKDAYTIEDYKGSGRTLLVVEADLTPVPVQYRSGDTYYYEDIPSISFDAIYDFESLIDYGYKLHNVISFESSNEFIGTVENYQGEPDDPTSSNNVSTSRAFDTAKDIHGKTELDYMDDLDEQRDDPSFVYAGAWTQIDILSAARTSLYKDVQVNNDGIWSEGTYYTQYYDDPPKEATEGGRMRTVYEGGQYTYRLRIMSDPETISTDMIIYDSLENFYAQGEDEYADNDYIDTGAPRWQGTFRGVDVSQLQEMGCDPVVYYSTKDGLLLSDESNPDSANTTNVNIRDENIWIPASEYDGDLADVKAIAIDCTYANENADDKHKNADGKFHLQPMESITALVKMQAPSGKEAEAYIAQKGRHGDSAMAYNNAYLLCTNMDKDQDIDHPVSYDTDNFVRKDYTKVGLKEYSLDAKKVWKDDNDRDGKRPDTITFRLLADGEPVLDEQGQPVTQVMDVKGGQDSVSFEHIPYTTETGEKIHYTIVEDPIIDEATGEAVYTAGYAINDTSYTFTNTHVPEKTSVEGQKIWGGDSASTRPASINVDLYANGKLLKTQIVRPASDGTWSYAFTDLFKYENGEEIEYTVKEVKTPATGDALDSYVQDQEETEDGFDLINTYHPFGDLDVSKTVTGTTEKSVDQMFTFTFAFSKMQAAEGGTPEAAPVFDEFDYEILDENGDAVTDEGGQPLTGKVASNDEIQIKGGQTIHIKELPQGTLYSITESDEDGFVLASKKGDAGTIKPNETQQASFINAYSAAGQLNLSAEKLLNNRQLQNYQFRFELYEMTEGVDEETGEPTDKVLRGTASSGVPSQVTEREDGTVESSAATATFGALRYTQADHGKTFVYRIYEVDTQKSGYTYSKEVYEVHVTVEDNGDGTLTIMPVYKTYQDEDGEVVSEQQTVDKAVFENTYEAEGDTPLRAWKSLPVRDLKDGEFTFELLDETGEPVTNEDGTVITAANSADGTVVFDPADVEALNFDEKDIGKTYYFAIREVVPAEGDDAYDETVIYDESCFGYAVTVVDNGDGTLYAEQKLVKPVFDEGDAGKIVSFEEKDAKLPVFENKLKDGGFSIQKNVIDSPEADPNQEFHFKVKLIGDKVSDDMITGYTLSQAGADSDAGSADSGNTDDDAVAGPAEDAASVADTAETITLGSLIDGRPRDAEKKDRMERGMLTAAGSDEDAPIAAPAAGELIASGTADDINGVGGVDWRITADGTLILGSAGQSQSFRNIQARGAYADASNTRLLGGSTNYLYKVDGKACYPWLQYRTQIKKVRFEGYVYGAGDMNGMFDRCINLTEVDFAGFHPTSNTYGMGFMFYGDSKLTTVKHLEVFNTADLIYMDNLFYNCSSLKELDLSGFQTTPSVTRRFENLFYGCSSLESLDLSGFDLLGAANNIEGNSAHNMFYGCRNLKTITFSSDFNFFTASNNKNQLPTPPSSQGWVRLDGGEGPYTPANVSTRFNGNRAGLSGTWVWGSLAAQYQVYFEADDAAGGTAPAWRMVAQEQALPANTFVKPGQDFDHWTVTKVVHADGTETTYEEDEETYGDEGSIPENKYKTRDKVYLKAVFKERDTSVEMKDGEFDLYLRDGEKATFDNIPAGTAYQVYEETPKGWVLVEQSGVSGVIEPLETQEAKFVNRYEPGTTSVQFFGTKTLDGKAAAGGKFTFVLKEGDTEIESVSTMDGGFIQFSPIVYKEAGTHTYTIAEVDPQDDTLDWDTHAETITVTVTEENGELTAETVIDEAGDGKIAFANKTRPGNLRITKAAEGLTDANKDDEFTFKITLNNADGMPLGSDDTVYWYVENNQTDEPSDDSDDQNTEVIEKNEESIGDSAFAAPSVFSLQNTIREEVRGNVKKAPLATTELALDDDTAVPDIFKPTTTEVIFTQLLPEVTSPINGVVQGRVRVTVYADGLCVMEPEDGISGAYTLNGTDTNNGSASYGRVFTNYVLRRITKFYVKGTCYAYGGCQHLFDAEGGNPKTMIQYADMRGMDVSKCTSLYEFMDYSDSIMYVDISTWEPPATCNMNMFICPNTRPKDCIKVMKLNSSLRFKNWTPDRIGGDANAKWITVEGAPSGTYTAQQLLNLYQNGQGTTATWVREGYNAEYTVKFDANGGTGEIEPIKANIVDGTILPEAAGAGIVNGDMIFVGWSKDKSAIYADYKAGDSFVGMPNSTTTLYAIWMSKDAYLIHFDAKGGFSSTQWKRANALDEVVELPTPTHPSGNFFLEWNTEKDGTGTGYTGTVTGDELGAKPGDTVELYAQWLGKNERIVNIEYYKQNVDNDEYSLDRAKRSKATVGSTIDLDLNEIEGFTMQPHDATYTVTNDATQTVRIYYNRNTYQIAYDGNGADSGQMNMAQQMRYDKSEALLKNTYQKKGSIFIGWSTEPGEDKQVVYTDGAKVQNLTAEDGATVTLYAQWLSNEDHKLEPTNGEIIVKCKAGESIVIPDLPAGTTYTIEEIDNPAGWSQKDEIDGNGDTIEANVTKDATVTNTYRATGQAQISAHKILNGGDIREDQFMFELVDADGEVLQRKTNGAEDGNAKVDGENDEMVDNPYYQTSLVQFDPITTYTQDDIGKDYTYTIREVDDVKGVACDPREYTATVHIEDAGKGQLAATVTYNYDRGNAAIEPIFVNDMKKANLQISKTIKDATEEVQDTVFRFTVDLTAADGSPLEGDYAVVRRSADGTAGTNEETISSGGTIELVGGETVTIEGLPHDAAYAVTEQPRENWEMSDSSGTEGSFEAGGTATASFTNTWHEPEKKPYDAKGSVQLTAAKTVEGGTIRLEDGFLFELMNENGDVLQTKGPDKVSTDADPEHDVAGEDVTESTVTFDPIEYTLDMLEYPADLDKQITTAFEATFGEYQKLYDAAKAEYEAEYKEAHPGEAIPDYMSFDTYLRRVHNTTLKALMDQTEEEVKADPANAREKTFTYYVKEAGGDDPVVEYDTSMYFYKVRVVDKGDGTLDTSDVTFWKAGSEPAVDEYGEPILDEFGEPVYEDLPQREVRFINKKSADLKVRKEDSRTRETLSGTIFTIEKTDAAADGAAGGDAAGSDAAGSADGTSDGDIAGGGTTGSNGQYLQADGTLGDLPYFFVTGEKGTFEVKGVPAGTYVLTETFAPFGYGKAAPITFDVKEGQIIEDGSVVSVIVVHDNKEYGRLKIEKTIDRWESSSPVTAVFHIEGVFRAEDGTETPAYDNVVSITFESVGTQSVTLEDIPKDAYITVTEEYAGAGYKIQGEGVQEIREQIQPKSENPDGYAVSFTDSYNDEKKPGYGATNTYENDGSGNWSWKSDLERIVKDDAGHGEN